MYKVVARIREGSNTLQATGIITDEYEKTITLPFPPYEGLVIDELTNHSKIVYLSYSIEEKTFVVVVEDIGPRNIGSQWEISATTMKRGLISRGWTRTFIDD